MTKITIQKTLCFQDLSLIQIPRLPELPIFFLSFDVIVFFLFTQAGPLELPCEARAFFRKTI